MDFNETIKRLQSAQGDPERLTLATVDVVLIPYAPELRIALEVAAVPHWFDARILGLLLETDETSASKLVKDLCSLPMVESFPIHDGWNVHEATRLALRNQLAKEEPTRLAELSVRAAKCFETNDPSSRVETIYHRLLAAPEDAADELDGLWKEWDNAGRYEPLQALGVALDELIRTDSLTGLARARALVCFGWIREGQITLRKAKEHAREALDLFRERAHEAGEVDAHDQLGWILQTVGDLPGALAAHRQALQISMSLAERNPEDADRQREVSVSHNKLGRVLEAEGSLPAALVEYQAHKEIIERLSARDPENTNWLRELSVSHTCVGDVLQAQGNLAEALLEFKADKEIMQRLTEHDPENTGWQSDLSTSHNRLGNVIQIMADALPKYKVDDDLTEQLREMALLEFKAAKEIMQRLTERDGENALWQRSLEITHECVGLNLETLGRFEESLIECEAANLIAERLVYHEATNEQWQRDVERSRETVQRLRRTLASVAGKEAAEE